MPLQVNSLKASTIESKTIMIEGAPASVFPTIIGDLFTNNNFTKVDTNETIVNTLLVPANFLSGLQETLPSYSATFEIESLQYSNLTFKVYVNTTNTIGGNLLTEETFSSNNMVRANFEVGSGNTVGDLINVDVPKVPELTAQTSTVQLGGTYSTARLEMIPSIIKYDKNKLIVLGNQKNTAVTDGLTQNTGAAALASSGVETYDNFDVSVNQYLVITAQFSEKNSVGIKPVFVGVRNSNSNYLYELPQQGVKL